MSTHRSTWKRRERQAAAIFGAMRQPLSGSAGRADRSRSDSTHDKLFIETKLRASSAMVSLFDATRALARAEGKTPLLLLATKNKPGFVLVLDVHDLPAVAAEYRAELPGDVDPPDGWPPRSPHSDPPALEDDPCPEPLAIGAADPPTPTS